MQAGPWELFVACAVTWLPRDAQLGSAVASPPFPSGPAPGGMLGAV